VISAAAKSAARVVYDHFGGAEQFPAISAELMDAVDKADSADFSEDEILEPQGWARPPARARSRTTARPQCRLSWSRGSTPPAKPHGGSATPASARSSP
jgi:hypothetical protein